MWSLGEGVEGVGGRIPPRGWMGEVVEDGVTRSAMDLAS